MDFDKIFKDWEIPPWDLHIYKDKLLGEGNFGKVYLATWRDTLVVAKVVDVVLVVDIVSVVVPDPDILIPSVTLTPSPVCH